VDGTVAASNSWRILPIISDFNLHSPEKVKKHTAARSKRQQHHSTMFHG